MEGSTNNWIPVFTGMTKGGNPQSEITGAFAPVQRKDLPG